MHLVHTEGVTGSIPVASTILFSLQVKDMADRSKSSDGAPPQIEPQKPAISQLQHTRRERHKRWIASLSERDWARIAELAERVTPRSWPARLEDLDAPGIAVACWPADQPAGTSGERIGRLRDGKVAVLVWEIDR